MVKRLILDFASFYMCFFLPGHFLVTRFFFSVVLLLSFLDPIFPEVLKWQHVG